MSRMGPGDHKVPDGMGRIVTTKTRDRHDRIIVQEKLDGSCCAVALFEGTLHPLVRAGWPAMTSKYPQHHVFHDWVLEHADRFLAVLREGERLVGEWLAQAHGTRYDLAEREPFVAFDIMVGARRMTHDSLEERLEGRFARPPLVATVPITPAHALVELGEFGRYGALDPIEGVVYRCERHGEVEFLAKFVRPDKQDGGYLPEISQQEAVWNWSHGARESPSG
jgi:hypothetical protein